MKDRKRHLESYWKLSYHEKFKRTLWLIPVVFLFLILPDHFLPFEISKYLIFVVLMIGVVIQVVYTYKKYKEEENNIG